MSKDLKYLGNCLEKLSHGDYSFSFDEAILKKNNDAGRMARLIKTIAENEKENAAAGGNLAEGAFSTLRASAEEKGNRVAQAGKVMGNVVAGIESTCREIQDGNLDARINTGGLKGGYLNAANAVNGLLDSLAGPLKELENAVQAMNINDYTIHIEDAKGPLSNLTCGMENLLKKFRGIQSLFSGLSVGDFDKMAKFAGGGALSDNDALIPAVSDFSSEMDGLLSEIAGASEKLKHGKLENTELNADAFRGGYKEIADNINDILQSICAPVSEWKNILSALSKNDFAQGLENKYSGVFEEISGSIESIRQHMIITRSLAKQISSGDTGKLEEIKAVEKLGDKDDLTPALINMMENITNIENETSKMAEAAKNGDLLYRVNTGSVNGKYVDMLTSLNSAFDSMSEPIIEMSAVLEGLAIGDTKTLVSGEYNGVFGALKNDVNSIIEQNRKIVELISDILNKISSGNLNVEKVDDLQGDWNGIPVALNNILNSLNGLVGNIYTAVDEVAAGANQVSMASQELSRGATEQASSIEELTASIAEIASQTKDNAKNAGTASTLAKSMKDSAVSSNSEMDKMLTSMQEINDSSRNISKIIKVIDDIAFQTNLLALNAAVEAAHAGEHGKGFAVVAEEVRNLAARSANAAKDTTELIESSIKKVEHGTNIASNTAKTLGKIVSGVDKVAGLVENIAAASNEQATGITQINEGLEQVSKVVQTNSATSEESAAASEELSGQASQLKSDVEKFNLRAAQPQDGMQEEEAEAAAAEVSSDVAQDTSDSTNFGKY